MSIHDKIIELRGKFYNTPDEISENLLGALIALSEGSPIIVVDDFERENEGDLLIAGAEANVKNIAFMARYGRGIMCLPAAGELLDRLNIPLMVYDSTDPLNTAFTVSVDALEGVSTGVSATDRVQTIHVMLDPTSKPEQLARPGHLFPLRARPTLLEERQGHTEASVTLMEILGYPPLAVIAEIMNDDGTMARLPELQKMSEEFNIPILSIEEIIKELGL